MENSHSQRSNSLCVVCFIFTIIMNNHPKMRFNMKRTIIINFKEMNLFRYYTAIKPPTSFLYNPQFCPSRSCNMRMECLNAELASSSRESREDERRDRRRISPWEPVVPPPVDQLFEYFPSLLRCFPWSVTVAPDMSVHMFSPISLAQTC